MIIVELLNFIKIKIYRLHMHHTSSPMCKKYQANEKVPDDSFTYIMESVLDLKKDSFKWSRCSIKTLIETLK